jgi:hypothetical protein
MASDYNEWIQRVLRERTYDTVFKRNIDALRRVFPNESPVGGDRITEKFEVARSSPAAAYTKADVNPSPASNTIIKPYWNKLFYHTAIEIEGIDISNAKNGGTDLDLIEREAMQEAKSLWDIIFTAFMTQIKSDVDSTATYGSGSLSRTTYPTLASYEEATDTAITLALMRGMINSTTISKNCGPLSGYICLMEQAVYNKFRPLATAEHTLNMVTEAGRAEDMGNPEVANFDGLDILDPRQTQGMTTGDVFMLRKEDVHITEHRTLEMEQVDSGRDSFKAVMRVGINLNVVHPGFQGKMTSKD